MGFCVFVRGDFRGGVFGILGKVLSYFDFMCFFFRMIIICGLYIRIRKFSRF